MNNTFYIVGDKIKSGLGDAADSIKSAASGVGNTGKHYKYSILIHFISIKFVK